MAFDWIESHKGLRDHPKTVRLAAEWRDRKTCVIGHLHELWWWTLDYAPDGILRQSVLHLVPVACEWHGKPERFWAGLHAAGFTDVGAGGDWVIHDWPDYAARRLERLARDAERKRNARASGGHAPFSPADNGADVRGENADASGGSRARAGAGDRNYQPEPPETKDVAAAAVSSGQGASRARARGDGGFHKIGAFLLRPPSMTATAAAAADESLPDDVRARLLQPPIEGHAVG